MNDIAALCAAHEPVETKGRFPAGVLFGDWRITAFIGRGGSGEVYCAEHVHLGSSAAVKVLVREEKRAKERFEREAKLLAKLKSSAFPGFFSYGEENGCPYLAMELLEPGELPTGDRAVAQFMLKVCGAVGELHSIGCVHRDIKPGNILWRSPTEPVLADFGLVKQASCNVAPPEESLTIVDGRRVAVGTPGYGAPEQMERGEATAASDIHALGVLADRCFGGKPPRAWKRIIERATSSIPEHRYPSVAVFARAIRRRHNVAYAMSAGLGMLALMAAGMFLREPALQLWNGWRAFQNAPVLNASAKIDGKTVSDVCWYLDDKPVDMPHRILNGDDGKQSWMPRQLCAVAQKNGKTYSAKHVDIVPERIGRMDVQLPMQECLNEGTAIRIWMTDGTPFDFAWCPPEKDETGGTGFWIAQKRLTGRQYGSLLKEGIIRHTAIASTIQHDLSSNLPIQLEFSRCETVPVVSVPAFGITLEPPEVSQWRRGIRLADDWNGDVAEWAGVPPEPVGGGRRGGGWMKMDASGEEKFIGNFTVHNSVAVGTACVRYIAVSRFQHETNTVLYCKAQSLLRSDAKSDVARGEAMLKDFFKSDDMELKTLAMECCIERGLSSLEDFGGTNAVKRLRFAAIRRGEVQTLERLAVDDPDSDVRDEAYAKLSNPSPMVSARYISRIDLRQWRGDISPLQKAIQSMTDRTALEYIVQHSDLGFFCNSARSRLLNLDGRRE